MDFESDVISFISAAHKHKLRMLMVGGGAVNFHGYQRHSADVDFWIDLSPENLNRLKKVLNEIGFIFKSFPPEVERGEQNISLKISPFQEIELITSFNPGKTFDEAVVEAIPAMIKGFEMARYHVLNLEDLINSKIKSGRPKDILDIQELQRINRDQL